MGSELLLVIVVGSGIGKRLASVQWGTAGQMAGAWLLTIPAAVLHVVTQRTPVRANDLDRSPAATRTESRGGVAVAASSPPPSSTARALALRAGARR
jgi:hypothetical protein